MNEKEHDIDTVELFEKENESNNENSIGEEPINEGNDEEEIIPEVPKLEILIENDLERGKSEVIENEVSDEVSSDEDELQEEFKKEIKKIKLGMLQLIEQLKNVEKVIEVDKIENIERIEVGTEIRKLKEPEGRDKKKILKWIKKEKE